MSPAVTDAKCYSNDDTKVLLAQSCSQTYTTLLVDLLDRYEPALPETIPEYHAQRMSYASLRLRLRHSDDARNQISCFASPVFVLASSNVLTVRSSGYEIEVGRRSHESTPQGIRAPATHHLPLYTIF